MKAFVMFLAVAIGAVAGIAASQDAAAAATSGEVVLYDAGKAIVIRHADDRVVKYVISPELVAPAGVEVGGRVSLTVEPGTDGVVRVTRLTTLTAHSAPPTAVVAPAGEGKSEITTVYGTVTEYEPGRSITVAQPDRKSATFAIDRESEMPERLARGRRVVVRTVTRAGFERPIVRKVTITKKRPG